MKPPALNPKPSHVCLWFFRSRRWWQLSRRRSRVPLLAARLCRFGVRSSGRYLGFRVRQGLICLKFQNFRMCIVCQALGFGFQGLGFGVGLFCICRLALKACGLWVFQGFGLLGLSRCVISRGSVPVPSFGNTCFLLNAIASSIVALWRFDCRQCRSSVGAACCLNPTPNTQTWKSPNLKGPKDPMIRCSVLGQQLCRLVFWRVYDRQVLGPLG